MPPLPRPNGSRPRLAEIINGIDVNEYDTRFRHRSSETSDRFPSSSSSEFEIPSESELYSMPSQRSHTARRTRKRSAAEAVDLADYADNEDSTAAGPSRKRRNTGTASRRGQGGSSRSQGEPIVIEDLDDEDEVNAEAEKLKETLQKQREDQVKAQEHGDTEPPRLNKLQCVICMDSFTDMTATSCGHIFCHECLISALKASEARRQQATGHQAKKSQCPVCRTNLNRTKATDVIPLLIMKKGAATQPRRAKNG